MTPRPRKNPAPALASSKHNFPQFPAALVAAPPDLYQEHQKLPHNIGSLLQSQSETQNAGEASAAAVAAAVAVIAVRATVSPSLIPQATPQKRIVAEREDRAIASILQRRTAAIDIHAIDRDPGQETIVAVGRRAREEQDRILAPDHQQGTCIR